MERAHRHAARENKTKHKVTFRMMDTLEDRLVQNVIFSKVTETFVLSHVYVIVNALLCLVFISWKG